MLTESPLLVSKHSMQDRWGKGRRTLKAEEKKLLAWPEGGDTALAHEAGTISGLFTE